MDRTFHAFQLHAHIDGDPIGNYRTLFESIQKVKPKQRKRQIEDRVIALSKIELTRSFVILTVQDGDTDVKPLFYDQETNTERVGDKEKSELLSTRTHAVLDLTTRYMAVEFNMRGAKATHVQSLIWMIAQNLPGMKNFDLEMPPVVGAGFLEELEKYSRIRLARVNMVRPNDSWDDCAEVLTGEAKSSNAQKIHVEFIASTGQSLSTTHGIIGTLKQLARKGLGLIENAYILGRKAGSAKDVPLKLKDHTEQRKVMVEKVGADGYPEPAVIKTALMQYLKDLRQHDEGDASE